jgi:hypothetical protein
MKINHFVTNFLCVTVCHQFFCLWHFDRIAHWESCSLLSESMSFPDKASINAKISKVDFAILISIFQRFVIFSEKSFKLFFKKIWTQSWSRKKNFDGMMLVFFSTTLEFFLWSKICPWPNFKNFYRVLSWFFEVLVSLQYLRCQSENCGNRKIFVRSLRNCYWNRLKTFSWRQNVTYF